MPATNNDSSNNQSEDMVMVNGIIGDTGDYLVPPVSIAEVANLMRAQKPTDDEAARDKAVKRRQAKSGQEVLGLPQGVDPSDFWDTGWAIVFHKDEDAEVKKALRPLFDHRLKMIRDDFQADDADKIVKWIDSYNGEGAREWLVKNKADFATVEPTCMPYYILLVGSPEKISFRFGHLLSAGYAVGRLFFDKVDDYKAYVKSVIDYETAAGKPAPTSKDIVFWGPRQVNDGATRLSSEFLVKPMSDETQTKVYERLFRKDKLKFNKQLIAPADSKKEALMNVFKRKKGKPAPSLLFTASHGVAWKNENPLQATAQGALLCQDYFGLTAGALKPEHYLAGSDLTADANVFGMICFLFACYGAGTPNENRFKFQREVPAVPAKPSFSKLPQAMLSHKNGSALGVFGHVERAWQTSIVTAGVGKQLQPFEDAFYTILSGRPLGHALVGFVSRANEMSRLLTGKIDEGKATDAELADLWLTRNDAETFILFGDPAVRLRKEDLQ